MENVKKTSVGMDENIEAALSYFFGLLTGILFFIFEKENKFVRFHAMQSILVFLAVYVINMVLGIFLSISYVTMMLFPLIYLIEIILWLFLMYKAYQGEKFMLPVIGDIAEKQVQQ